MDGKLDLSNEEEKIAFNTQKTTLSELGIQISKFLTEYFFLNLNDSNNREIVLVLSTTKRLEIYDTFSQRFPLNGMAVPLEPPSQLCLFIYIFFG